MVYADDALLFYEAEKSHIQFLNLTLLLFEASSRLHINIMKSIIDPVNKVTSIDELEGIMGCKIVTLPSTYLGLPLGDKFRSCEI